MSTIVEAFNNCILLSNKVDRRQCLLFLRYLKQINVVGNVKNVLEAPIETAISRLNAICNMYVKFENVHDTHNDVNVSTDLTAEEQSYTVYGSVLIDAIDRFLNS